MAYPNYNNHNPFASQQGSNQQQQHPLHQPPPPIHSPYADSSPHPQTFPNRTASPTYQLPPGAAQPYQPPRIPGGYATNNMSFSNSPGGGGGGQPPFTPPPPPQYSSSHGHNPISPSHSQPNFATDPLQQQQHQPPFPTSTSQPTFNSPPHQHRQPPLPQTSYPPAQQPHPTSLYDPPVQRFGSASPGPNGPRQRYDSSGSLSNMLPPQNGNGNGNGYYQGGGGPPITTQMPEANPGDIYLPDPRYSTTPQPGMMQHSYSGQTLYGQTQQLYGTGPQDGDLSGPGYLTQDTYGQPLQPRRSYSPDPSQMYPTDDHLRPMHSHQDSDLADEPLLQRIHSTPGGEARYGDPFGGGGNAENGNGNGDADGGMPGSWQGGAAGVGHPGSVDPDSVIAPTAHYGPAPDRMIRRLKTTKRVQLFRGNLVLECPVPSALLDLCPLNHRTEQEFSLMRYTAVTCNPDDFEAERYTLRQKQLYEPVRKTEIFIVITMYNEDEELFARTMRGVMANIAHLNDRDRSPTWKDDGWKKVVVCIVVDGRKIFNPRTRAMIAALGAYQEGVAKNVVNGKPVTAHVYEYTTQLHIDSKHRVVPGGTGKKWAPVQIILCVKENNAKKINSHRWFFNAFGPILKPTVCVLLDVGTDPAPTSIYHLWKTFDLKPTCGGACGEIVALKGRFWKNLLNPLVAAQNFEYKMSNILDKPLESAFGYITVLPGAFSAYRYKALENDAAGEGPLKQYFLGETMHGADAGIFTANMYLAEDRILCWELVSKRNSNWVLHYVKSARAITDVPDAVPELVKQRRRWLNGSFFAAIHSIVHFGYIYRSSHSFGRKFFLHIELVYQTFNAIFAWLSLGNYYIAFIVLTQSLETYHDWFKYINIPLQYIYLGLLIMCFLLSMGNRPDGSRVAYGTSMVAFAIITIYMLFAAIYLAVNGIESSEVDGKLDVDTALDNKVFRNIVLSLVVTYGLYIAASLIALDPWHMLTSFAQYMLLAPSYINVLNVYAFSNVHDVSWGTKGSDKVSLDLGSASAGKGGKKDEVILAVPTEDKDINALYADELRVLAEPPPKVEVVVSATQKQEDYYKTFRTNVLLAWVLSNGALAVGVLATTSKGTSLASTYMGILLYTVAALAAFRFLGASIYLIVRLFQRE